MPGQSPLPIANQDNWQKLADAQAAVNRATEGIMVSEQCGIDCQQQRALAKALQAQLDRMRAAIFPNGPPRK